MSARDVLAAARIKASGKAAELGLMLANIEWLPNQRKFLRVVMTLTETAPREEVILAVIGKRGASDVEAEAVINRIKAIVNE